MSAMSAPLPELCCPACRGRLETRAARLECRECGSAYPVVAGIPDLRRCSDPYIGIEDDRRKALHLAEMGRSASFAELLDHYFAVTPEVPAALAARYRAHHLAGLRRGRAVLERRAASLPGLTRAERRGGDASPRSGEVHAGEGARAAAGGTLLDLGCGTAGFLAAAAQAGEGGLLGIDVALRWLVVARRRLDELGLDRVPLVCGCADHLPLPEAACWLVVAENLFEHVSDLDAVLAEVRRVTAPGGGLMARTVNRFVLGPEPHVDLWGVGFLPRRWMDGYVRRRRAVDYRAIRLRSAPELRRAARRLPGARLAVRFPRLALDEIAHHGGARAALLRLYRVLTAPPPLRAGLGFFGPFVDLVGRFEGPPEEAAGGR